MRHAWIWLILPAGPVLGQDGLEMFLKFRFGFEVNQRDYPQMQPRDTLRSIVKALEGNRFDYLLAHLADPGFVEPRVADYKKAYPGASEPGRSYLAFNRLVKETQDHFLEDPALLRELRRFAGTECDWDIGEETAVGTVPMLAGRAVFLRKLGDRWFLENRQRK